MNGRLAPLDKLVGDANLMGVYALCHPYPGLERPGLSLYFENNISRARARLTFACRS